MVAPVHQIQLPSRAHLPYTINQVGVFHLERRPKLFSETMKNEKYEISTVRLNDLEFALSE